VCVRHWSCAQVSKALQQVNPINAAACEPLPSPYQAVQDMMSSGQEQLTGTYRASVSCVRMRGTCVLCTCHVSLIIWSGRSLRGCTPPLD
jgi:hypothetical protein